MSDNSPQELPPVSKSKGTLQIYFGSTFIYESTNVIFTFPLTSAVKQECKCLQKRHFPGFLFYTESCLNQERTGRWNSLYWEKKNTGKCVFWWSRRTNGRGRGGNRTNERESRGKYRQIMVTGNMGGGRREREQRMVYNYRNIGKRGVITGGSSIPKRERKRAKSKTSNHIKWKQTVSRKKK